MNEDSITLTLKSGQAVELPIRHGTDGPSAVDIASLYAKTGLFTYDQGFVSTASCTSGITYIDGDAGILRYRGYPIEDLAEKCEYTEVAHLLMYGELPNPEQLELFKHNMHRYAMINESLKQFFQGFHHNSHPMAMMVGVMGSLSAFYHDSLDINDPEHREISALRMIAKAPTIAAAAYKRNRGEPFVYPRNDYEYCGDFLRMMFSTPCCDFELDPVAERALNILFILHADHEQNASTSTVRLAASSGANPFTCVAAGIASLWGPAHGGANEAVLHMLGEIGTVQHIPEFIARAKDKNDPFRLMGFGHRVYKNYDPRARIIREVANEVLDKYVGVDTPLFDLARELERIALEDDYFIERKLYPNVDFYSGIIYRALGFPTNMFTPLFAIARTSGWVSHWLEMMDDPDNRIGRPRQVYTGAPLRPVKPIYAR